MTSCQTRPYLATMLLLFLPAKRVQPSKSNRNALMQANLTLPCSSYSSMSGSSSWLHLFKSSSYRLFSLPKLIWAAPCLATSLAATFSVKSRSTCIIYIPSSRVNSLSGRILPMMGMPKRHATSSSVMVIFPTGRWKVMLSSCHLSDIAQMNPWEMFSYPLAGRGVRPDIFTSFQIHLFCLPGEGNIKFLRLNFFPCKIPFTLCFFRNWNTKTKNNKQRR